MKNIAKVFLFITIPIVIILLSFESVAFDTDLFLKKINDYGVFEQLEKKQAEDQVTNLVSYLKGKEKLNTNFYSDKEILHLTDVKKIFFIVNVLAYIFYILAIILLFYLRKKLGRKDFFKTLLLSGLISFIFYILLLLVGVIGFTKIFYYFHLALFNNEYWLLDPSYEKLVIIFPEKFFLDISQLIFAKTIIISLLTSLVSLSFLKLNRKN